MTKEYQLITNIIKEKEFSTNNINWKLFLQLCVKHGVLQYIYHELKEKNNLNKFPKQIRQILKKRLENIIHRNLDIEIKTNQILKQLLKITKDIIILKGPAIAKLYYPHLGLREYVDIDLLVKKKDMDKLIKFFKKQDFNINHHNIHPYDNTAKKQGYPSFDIITSPASFYLAKTLDMNQEMWWKDCRKIELFNLNVKALSLYNQLLFLIYHTAKHKFQDEAKLKWYLDIKKIFEKKEINKDKLKTKLKKHGIFNIACMLFTIMNKEVDFKNPYKKIKPKNKSFLFLLDKKSFIIKFIFYGLFPPKKYLNYKYRSNNMIINYTKFLMQRIKNFGNYYI